MVVKKKNEKWRVCVDFTDLNKVCLKDPYPIPQIDQLVDATVRHPRMGFLMPSKGIIKYLYHCLIKRRLLFVPLMGTTIIM